MGLPGLAWTGPRWQLARATVSPYARWRTSIDHRLRIDYGGLFDPSSLAGGRRQDVVLGATAVLDSNWALSLDWHAARQRTSGTVSIFRSGAVAGTVFQPRLVIDDYALTLSKKF